MQWYLHRSMPWVWPRRVPTAYSATERAMFALTPHSCLPADLCMQHCYQLIDSTARPLSTLRLRASCLSSTATICLAAAASWCQASHPPSPACRSAQPALCRSVWQRPSGVGHLIPIPSCLQNCASSTAMTCLAAAAASPWQPTVPSVPSAACPSSGAWQLRTCIAALRRAR